MFDRPVFTPDSPIPERLYFKIGEVADLVGVQTHVLRYWEKELPSVRPSKSQTNQRRYRRRDIEVFRQVRKLLHEEKYTLAGARRRLTGGGDEPAEVAAPAESNETPVIASESIEQARGQLHDLIRFAGEEP